MRTISKIDTSEQTRQPVKKVNCQTGQRANPAKPTTRMTAAPHILLVNPWIHDFAAYDFWAKPLGLLVLAALLRQHGFQVSLHRLPGPLPSPAHRRPIRSDGAARVLT